MTHHLKTLIAFFKAVEDGTKTFEVRFIDRNYNVGDTLVLHEFDGKKLTGNKIAVNVTYLLCDSLYCKDSYCVMAIHKIGDFDNDEH